MHWKLVLRGLSLMKMFNPPSRERLSLKYSLRPLHISHGKYAEQLGLPLDIFKRLLCGEIPIDTNLAQRLSATLAGEASAFSTSCRKLANTRQFLA
jgi:plasmid maintenance system antidote protein VapI